jgi:tryptophanyl-tRNA synthetase
MATNYKKGGYGFGHAKTELLGTLLEVFAKPREIFNHYMNNLPELEKQLTIGEKKADAIANETLMRVRGKLGLLS